MKDQKKAEEIAAERFQLLSPLLANGIDAAKMQELKEKISTESGISERTIRRYLAMYSLNGFSGLKPKSKGRPPTETIAPEIIGQAIILRREVPSRSVAQIIQILEWEGLVEPGEIKRSTLQEKLANRGYSTRHMRMYADSGVASRRFQHSRRNSLWHSDIKYGPFLPIGPNGSLKQVYLVSFIDDATRFVLYAAFYPTLDQVIVEDCFRTALQRHGLPEKTYFDNGKQYANKWMKRTCSKLGIRLLYAKPYSPEATGKVEIFNKYVDRFLAEAELEKPKTLDHLNELFQVWLSECYQNKAHSALKNNQSPQAAYQSDNQPIRFVDTADLTNAFLHCETRVVDKAGCISFMSKKYEVGIMFVGCRVDVVYDPADITELTIEYEGHKPWQAREIVIGERAGKRPPLPEHMQKAPAKYSRLLTAAAERNRQRQKRQVQAVSYRVVAKEGNDNV